ncbi:MAG: hypothetical protein K6E96_06160 [Bacteroidales bacterium]|nr:hypothetical protein [Bacteroidales bacterium]
MKRFLLHIILFIPIALLGTALLLCLLGGTGLLANVVYHLGHDDHSFTRFHEADTVGQVDVLFLGSSHAYRTFDTRIYAERGFKSFNLGSSNQSYIQTEMLLHRYLDGLNPRLVVIEVHPDVVANDGVESSLYLLSNLPPSWCNVPMVLREHNAKVFCTAIYAAFHNTFSAEYRHFEEPVESNGNTYDKGGYVERIVEYYSPHAFPPTTIAPRHSQLTALQRCTHMLRKRKIPYILVEVPDTRSLQSSYTNHADFHNIISNYGKFYFNQLSSLSDSLHYYDEGHLNQLGVDLYNNYFCDSILSFYLR